MNPDPFTLRQLIAMTRAKCRSEWDRTSALLALQVNMNRAKNSSPVKAFQFNPFRTDAQKKIMVRDDEFKDVMKTAFGLK